MVRQRQSQSSPMTKPHKLQGDYCLTFEAQAAQPKTKLSGFSTAKLKNLKISVHTKE